MAKFRITDNQSGKTLVISGDTPPSEQEAEQLFQQSGIRNQAQQGPMTGEQALAKQVPLNQPVPESPQQGGALGAISKFLMPDVVKGAQQNIQQMGAGNLTPTQPSLQSVGASALGPLGETIFGTDQQKTQQAGNREMGAVLQGALGLAGGVQGGINAVGNAARAKSLVPSRIATTTRNASANVDPSTFTGDEIGQAFSKAANETVGGIRQQAMKYAVQDVERLKGTNLTTKQLVEEISKQWNASHSEKGVQLTKAQAQYALQARDELMKILRLRAPEVAKQTQEIGKLIGGQKNFVKLMKWIIPPTVIGGGVLKGMSSQ